MFYCSSLYLKENNIQPRCISLTRSSIKNKAHHKYGSNNISKPIQSMVEKKHANANELKKEIAPLIEFKELMLSDSDPTDDEVEKMMEKIKNI